MSLVPTIGIVGYHALLSIRGQVFTKPGIDTELRPRKVLLALSKGDRIRGFTACAAQHVAQRRKAFDFNSTG